ncbi:hypothetical protein FACS18947_4150 [Bacteroidia bacterium]|nr:hypothetical protein FACS18947_4150 [Bacteroidia bacterium]
MFSKLNINNHNIFEDFAYTICTNFYLIKEWLVVSFLYDNNRYYSFTNLLSNDQKVGVIEEHIPFLPQ